MSGFSKLGITLTSVFSFLFLSLLAEIIYLLWRRRQQFRRKRTRVEPAGAKNSLNPTSLSVSGSDVLKLDGIYSSRVLFTIKEEEVETELEGYSVSVGERKTELAGVSPEMVVIVGGGPDFDADPPFLTPCASPPYFTPSSSPSRERK